MQHNYIPQPRECSTLTSSEFDTFLIGGNSNETIKEISLAKVESDTVYWEKVDWTCQPSLPV
jgi:hypothetical protein